MNRARILILGAAGRDFHTFNIMYRGDPSVEVVAFTAQQIPHIEDRRYPTELAGELYPVGIPVESEDDLEALIQDRRVDRCVMAYSDVSYQYVMNLASRVNVAGAAFELPDPRASMLRSERPVVAVCASRTGAGKSPTSRAVVSVLRDAGARVGIIRHPMPYGELVKQRVQRFASAADLTAPMPPARSAATSHGRYVIEQVVLRRGRDGPHRFSREADEFGHRMAVVHSTQGEGRCN